MAEQDMLQTPAAEAQTRRSYDQVLDILHEIGLSKLVPEIELDDTQEPGRPTVELLHLRQSVSQVEL